MTAISVNEIIDLIVSKAFNDVLNKIHKLFFEFHLTSPYGNLLSISIFNHRPQTLNGVELT